MFSQENNNRIENLPGQTVAKIFIEDHVDKHFKRKPVLNITKKFKTCKNRSLIKRFIIHIRRFLEFLKYFQDCQKKIKFEIEYEIAKDRETKLMRFLNSYYF